MLHPLTNPFNLLRTFFALRRFVAVSIGESDDIFIFGGQQLYNKTCDCYRLSDDVLKYHEKFEISEIDAGVGRVGGVAIGLVLTLGLGLGLL